MIEPGPVKTKFADNAQEQLPTEEEMENVDEETKSFLTALYSHMFAIWDTMWQTPEDISEVVLEAISSPNPDLRYLTNEGYRSIISEKYVDVTGDAPLEAMRKRSLPNKE